MAQPSTRPVHARLASAARALLYKNPFAARCVGWYGLYRFATREKNSFSNIMQIFALVYRDRTFRTRLTRELLSQEACRRTILERKRIRITPEELATCAPGTLGHAFHRFMKDNNLKFVIPFDAPVHTDFQYIIHRILATHDLYHTLLEARTTLHGEAIVAAFTHTQIHAYAPALLYAAAGSLYCAITANDMIATSSSGTTTGFLLARSSRQLFNADWDAWWHLPLATVQRAFDLDPQGIRALVTEVCRTGRDPFGAEPGLPLALRELLNDDTCLREVHTLPSGRPGTSAVQVEDFRPASAPAAVAILGRALFTTGRYLSETQRPSLAACLVRKGIQVLVPHATESGDRACSFEAMLEDTTQVIELARGLRPGTPVFLVGHSLSGLCFLVQQGLAPAAQVQGIVTLGASLWHRHSLQGETSGFRLRLTLSAGLARLLQGMFGQVPARRLGFGDYDEHPDLVRQVLIDPMERGNWRSLDGSTDFRAALCECTVPVLAVASRTDRYAPTRQVQRFHAGLPREPRLLAADGLGHIALARDERAWAAWEQIAAWILAQGR